MKAPPPMSENSTVCSILRSTISVKETGWLHLKQILSWQEKRKTLKIPCDVMLFLSIGELSARKNQKIVIEALGKMEKECDITKIMYLVVGEGEMQKDFEFLVKKYKLGEIVKFLGYRNDVDELCKIADCFVHPSVREGLGISPLEAMASGLPLISTYVNGIRDYTKDGKSGCCINPNDVAAMVASIKKMRTDSKFRATCANNNIKTVKMFDIKYSNQIMNNVYSDFK